MKRRAAMRAHHRRNSATVAALAFTDSLWMQSGQMVIILSPAGNGCPQVKQRFNDPTGTLLPAGRNTDRLHSVGSVSPCTGRGCRGVADGEGVRETCRSHSLAFSASFLAFLRALRVARSSVRCVTYAALPSVAALPKSSSPSMT